MRLALRWLSWMRLRKSGADPVIFRLLSLWKRETIYRKFFDAEAEEHRKSRISPIRNPSVWARHVTWAKVLMAGIEALHQSKIAHADLKPANVYLIQDPTIKAGYQLKLIDMDFSLLTDHRAPWHGHQGYIGSDNYRSPEHLTRRQVPDAAIRYIHLWADSIRVVGRSASLLERRPGRIRKNGARSRV